MFDTNLTYMEKKYIETSIQKIIKDIASNNDEQIVVDAYNDDLFMRVRAPFLDGKYNMKWMKHHDFGFNESKNQTINNKNIHVFCVLINNESRIKIEHETIDMRSTFVYFKEQKDVDYIFINIPFYKKESVLLYIADVIMNMD